MIIEFHNPQDTPPRLQTRKELTAYLNTSIPRPAEMTDISYDALSDSERTSYDRARRVWLSGGITIDTPDVKDARRVVAECFAGNVARNSGHSGLMLSGYSGSGKTTATKVLMQYIYNAYKRQTVGFDEDHVVPVAYIEVSSGSTAKLLISTLAIFYGMTPRPGESMVSIRRRVVEVIKKAGTQLIVVDEIHMLGNRTIGNGESVDVLKGLHNELPCTFVYAGLNIEEGDLLNGERGQQLASRFDIHTMTRFNEHSAEDRKTWKSLIGAFEKDLLLRHHETGSLANMHTYLLDRTNGSIGTLAKLLTSSARRAIMEPNRRELIDEALLEEGSTDFSAQRAQNRRKLKLAPAARNSLLVALDNQ